ncbi:MAG: glycosyltransferase family 39 protein [Burkholderiales bacterium]|nr:glycosyltransferase family 39 protein [Burkholderiales bacterium]
MSIFNNAKLNDIFLLFIWCILLFLCAHTLRGYYLPSQPPLWDSLVYQNESLYILTDWLDGDWQNALNGLYASRAPAHVFTLTLGYLILGINSSSPYVVSALFGFACLSAIYVLSVELGATRLVAFWGVAVYSISTNFLYQNFLQTRNDFQLAFLITVSWILVLRAIKSGSYKSLLLAGACAGLGTLFKASAPGYVIFGILMFLIMPEKYLQLSLKVRFQFLAVFTAGALMVSAWHYLPHLQETLGYYFTWGEALAWKTSQYGLQSNWQDYLFYPSNIIHTHIGTLAFWFLFCLFVLLLIRKYFHRKSLSTSGRIIDEYSLIIMIVGAAILPLAFITWRQSYSSLGDVPVLPLLISSTIVLISKLSGNFTIRRSILIPVLLLGLGLSLPIIPIVERQFIANDLDKFNSEISKFREQYGLRNSAMLQVYGHPIYNVDTYSWSALVNQSAKNVVPKIDRDLSDVLFPEDANLIASKLARYPMLIIPEVSGVVIGGETFHTFNRMQRQINQSLTNEGQFVKLRTVVLENGKFPIHLALNKHYSIFRPVTVTPDKWTEWGGEVEYFSLSPAKLIWRGNPIRPIEEFRLVEKSKLKSTITFRYVKHINGVAEYQSDSIPGTSNLRLFELLPVDNKLSARASAEDDRKLAFYTVKTNVVRDERR